MVRQLTAAIVSIIFLLTSNLSIGRNEWDRVRFKNMQAGKKYDISSGTGFFVNPNYIVTNHHVVDRCRNIAVRGAVAPNLVSLIASNPEQDLALLYSSVNPKAVGTLSDLNNLKENYGLFIIGYPEERGQTGIYKSTRANVINIDQLSPRNSIIEFSDSVKQGNSGGPLLDQNANIVGVIRATKQYYVSHGKQQSYKTTGVAIGSDILKNFLDSRGVSYNHQGSKRFITNYQATKQAEDYIVNIHCVR